jgi:omega-hydroxy-beta-dihydromenaquinone-9 sulfotransferase
MLVTYPFPGLKKEPASMSDSPALAPAKTPPKRDITTPRLWLGCDGWAWLRLIMQGNFRFEHGYRHMLPIISMVSMAHSVLKNVQAAMYQSRINATTLKQDPIFILGHWRTGTTLLHELMILDAQFNYPTTYQCMEPNHFLLTEAMTKKYLPFLMLKNRPMDKMQIGFDRPQEDEFAMCMMGQPSPYLQFAFPNNQHQIDDDAYELDKLTQRQQKQWAEALMRFLKTLTFADPRQLVLKSPPHTYRIPTLIRMFPNAKFIHLVRNPYVLYSSTMNMWNSMSSRYGFQTPDNPNLREKVLSNFTRLYDRLEATKKLIPSNQYVEMRYEDLIAKPIDQLQMIYSKLGLHGFEFAKPRMQDYLNQNKSYETNKYELSPADREEIASRWAKVIGKYGYDLPKAKLRSVA